MVVEIVEGHMWFLEHAQDLVVAGSLMLVVAAQIGAIIGFAMGDGQTDD